MRGKRARVAALLQGYDGPHAERMRPAIKWLADGDEDELRSLIALARTDYRDVLMIEADRRAGRVPRRLSPEEVRALEARFARRSAPAKPFAGPSVDLQLTDVGARSPELLKTIRAATGLGLRDVATLLDRVPVRILAGTPRETAERVRAEISTAGGAAEIRGAG